MELRTVNLIDALVSILTLQNTLIMVKQKGEDMLLVSAGSSAIIYVVILGVTIRMLLKGIRQRIR